MTGSEFNITLRMKKCGMLTIVEKKIGKVIYNGRTRIEATLQLTKLDRIFEMFG